MKKQRGIVVQKKFKKILIMISTIAMFFTIVLLFVLQTKLSQENILETEEVQIKQVQNKIEENNQAITELKESLNKDYIAKANAFAYMIEQKPEMINNAQELEKVKKLLDVDELHVMDEKGTLLWGTEPSMFGFDFSTSDQTRPFLDALNNPSFTLAQEPQVNATKGILFQYIGVSRRDKKGIVQIGLQPQRLENALKNNEISNLLANISVGTNGYIFAINKADSKILAHKNIGLVGKTATEAGFPNSIISEKNTHGFATIDGTNVYYLSQPYNDMIIGAAVPRLEVYSGRNILTVIFFIAIFIIFGILISQINRLLKKQIIDGIETISNELQKITGGDLNTVVNVHTNEEFSSLSNGINEMVESIKNKMKESDQLVEIQDGVFVQVQQISDEINELSNNMLGVSESLTQGAQEQKTAVQQLSGAFEEVSNHINMTNTKAQSAKDIFTNVSDTLTLGNEQMGEMVDSMSEISRHSQKISSIIKSIDDIAFQTNILALNAAVEAARAGTAGKGFAVVADEVGNLAGKSAQSAKDTAQLIEAMLSTIEQGTQKTQLTAQTLSKIIEESQKSTELIDDISNISHEQLNLVSQVEQEVEHISTVVQNNSVSAQESEQSSQELAKEASSLKQLMNLSKNKKE